MTFVKGQSGNPDGGRSRKIFIDALNYFINADWGKDGVPALPKDAKVAHAMAQKLVKGALRDDWKPGEALSYLQEICDRAYGKPKQTLATDDEDGGFTVRVEKICPSCGAKHGADSKPAA